ncbi:MAG: UbiA-like polyprenyltransferase [Lentimicrobiaceae bacterium]|jgi:4-hydroxybenzoate polyprenyltransferase
MLFQKINAKVNNYLSLVKFPHTIFALPFALLGFSLATIHHSDTLSWTLLLLVLLSMLFARNAAMSFNRWADRHIDEVNPRTAQREIPARIIGHRSALVFCIANALLFVAATWFINPLCFYLSPIALIVILGYSLTKRFTALSHFVLGSSLALAPTGAYLAVTGTFDWIPVIISLSVLFWVSGFDIIYALQDDDFDRENHLRSIPVLLGRKNALLLSLVLHIITFLLLAAAGVIGDFKAIYWSGLVIFSLLLFYQHTIVKYNDLGRVNMAFFTLNGIASIVFSIFAIADLLI